MRVGIVSGYFNPIHAGHIEYINAAKNLCDFLIVIVNNDNQVKIKKSKVFMDEKHRLIIVENLKSVNLAILSIDQDSSVASTLTEIAKIFGSGNNTLTFYNSGDRNTANSSTKETEVCANQNIKIKFIDLPKIYSSSELIK